MHARGTHDALAVGRVDQQADIARQKRIVKLVRDRLHLGEVCPVQLKVCQLRVCRAGKRAGSLRHRFAQHLRQVGQTLLVPGALQLLRRHTPGKAHQPQRIGSHGLGLQNGLGVVIIVFQTEELHQSLVGDKVLQFREHRLAVCAEGGVYLAGIHTGHVLIAAVAQELGALLKILSLQHAPGAVGGEHLSLPRAQHGR